jgi:hypothetical protein
MKPQTAKKRSARPKFDHKTDGVSRLPHLLAEWFGAHKANAVMDAVSSGHDERFARLPRAAAKGRQ